MHGFGVGTTSRQMVPFSRRNPGGGVGRRAKQGPFDKVAVCLLQNTHTDGLKSLSAQRSEAQFMLRIPMKLQFLRDQA